MTCINNIDGQYYKSLCIRLEKIDSNYFETKRCPTNIVIALNVSGVCL